MGRGFLLVLGLFVAAAGTAAGAERSSSPPDMFGGPSAEEKAPPFVLENLKGQQVRLEQLIKERRPVVLVTGSYSCPIYRQKMSALERLYDRYHERLAFFVLYTVEAHPRGSASPYAGREWVTDENLREGILVEQPASYEQRVALAARCQRDLRSHVPILVDGMDNAVWERYGKAPNAAYLIDSRGEVQLRQGWFEPAKFEQALLEVLQEEPPSGI